MRKFVALLCALLAITLSGCGVESDTELIVFAAASLTETLTELQPVFEGDHPGVKLVFNFDSSGTLLTQIQEGAACDVFLSAGQRQMDALDCLLPDSRIDLLENRVTLCVPAGNPAGLTGFDSLADQLREGTVLLCMGNADVPVGQYTQKILAYYGLDEGALAEAGCLTYGTNVKEVTTQVSEGSVDAGIIYCTDAFSAGLVPVDYATEAMCGRVIYPAAALNTTEHPALASEYLAFLQTEEAMGVFEKVGFARMNAS